MAADRLHGRTRNKYRLGIRASALVVLATAGLLAATRLPGWRLLALACAGVYAYLAVVAIAQPTQPGSWGVPAESPLAWSPRCSSPPRTPTARPLQGPPLRTQ